MTLNQSVENKKLYEEAQKKCAEEKINIPGSIQPFACLIIFDEHKNILKFSENIAEVVYCMSEDIISKNLKDIFHENSIEAIQAFIQNENYGSDFIIPLTLKNTPEKIYFAFLHYVNGLFILEIERSDEYRSNSLQHRKSEFFTKILNGNNLSEKQQYLVDSIRGITNHDRVLLYMFDADWNGEVIVESSIDNSKTYLGLHFPASDIPKQARDLYYQKPTRYIPNVDYEPQKIVPDDLDKNGHPIDLSVINSRSISPIHQNYMKNMGISGSMSFAVFKNSKLCGLVICHSKTSNYIEPHTRLLANDLVVLYSALLSASDQKAAEDAENHKRECMTKLAQAIRNPDEKGEVIEKLFMKLLEFMGANGVFLSIGETEYVFGDLPSENRMNEIIASLKAHDSESVYTSNSIENDLGVQSEQTNNICGVLAFPLPQENQSDFIIWFRKEETVERNWAGEPIKQIHKEQGNLKIVPRENFEVWKQIFDRHSKVWSKSEIQLAQEIAHIALAITQLVYVQKQNQILLHSNIERQKLEALGRMTGNISHEIKNTLQPVKLMANMLKDWKNLDEDNIERCIQILVENIELADYVIRDVLRFSRKSENISEKISVDILKDEVLGFIKNLIHSRIDLVLEIEDSISEGQYVEINVNSLHQILMNIVNNALHAMKDSGQLILHWRFEEMDTVSALHMSLREGTYVCIGIEDTGGGMDEKTMASAFDPFFSTKPPGEGTGLGLSISYKIVKECNGTIKAMSEIDKGSIFSIYLPVI